MATFTVTFADGSAQHVSAGSVAVGDGVLEFYSGPTPVGQQVAAVPIVDGNGDPTLAELSPADTTDAAES